MDCNLSTYPLRHKRQKRHTLPFLSFISFLSLGRSLKKSTFAATTLCRLEPIFAIPLGSIPRPGGTLFGDGRRSFS